MKTTGYALFRLSMGVNFLFHAINRYFYGVENFSNWLLSEFKSTFFSLPIIELFAYTLPIIEGIIGLSLILGIKTRWGLILGSMTISTLIIGSCMINKWDWVSFQMIYAICFYIMSEKIELNNYSLDNKLKL